MCGVGSSTVLTRCLPALVAKPRCLRSFGRGLLGQLHGRPSVDKTDFSQSAPRFGALCMQVPIILGVDGIAIKKLGQLARKVGNGQEGAPSLYCFHSIEFACCIFPSLKVSHMHEGKGQGALLFPCVLVMDCTKDFFWCTSDFLRLNSQLTLLCSTSTDHEIEFDTL